MKGIGVALGIGMIFWILALVFFSYEHSLLIALIAFLVTLWTNEALPLGVVSMLPILLFPILGILDVDAVTSNYANPIIFLFLGGFMLAIALEKIGLHTYFSAKLLGFFPKTSRGIIYALTITSALLSTILSNTTVTLMLMPVALFLSDNLKLKVRLLLATAYGSSIGGILTPIGTAPNLILLGFLESHQLPVVAFGEWMALMSPVVGIMLLLIPWLLSFGVEDVCVAGINHETPALSGEQKRLYGMIVGLAVILIANTFLKEFFGFALDEKLVLLGFGLLMFAPRMGFLVWEDTRVLPYEIIFLFGAGFSVAAAVSGTGLAADIAHKLSFISSMPLVLIFVVVALFVTFATEVTSNTALTSIAVPIFYEFSKQMPQSEGIIVMMIATVAASYAFMLPIATPPNAIVMSSRVVTVKEMATMGLKLNIIGVAVLSLVAYFVWRMML